MHAGMIMHSICHVLNNMLLEIKYSSKLFCQQILPVIHSCLQPCCSRINIQEFGKCTSLFNWSYSTKLQPAQVNPYYIRPRLCVLLAIF